MHDNISIPPHYQSLVKLVSCHEETLSGTLSVFVKLTSNMSAQDRGQFLLNLENELCLDNPRIRIWHTSLGDKNSLRNLRGIKIPSS